MSKPAADAAAMPEEGLIARLRDWWRNHNELANLPRNELDRMAGDFGMTGRELEELSTKGPHAADLMYQRMRALGLSTADVERIAHGLMRDLQKTCSCCNDKAECKKDLAERPDDSAWKAYCPNAIALESIKSAKGRFPL